MTPQPADAVGEESQSSSGASCLGGGYYLTPEARRALPNYQYKGADLSLTYRYVLSPLAAFLVELLPRTIAPNSITLIGLLWMLSSYGIYWYYAPSLEFPSDLEEEDSFPPRWIFLWNGIAILMYQTLDNMDGKQARRTGSSSPLGLLFDHGCDAINPIFGSVNWIIGMALVPRDNLLQCWALIFGPVAMFYTGTWEEYYTGELIMPIINGPSEGLIGGACLSFASYWYGPSFWQGTDWYDALSDLLSLSSEGSSWTLRNCDFIILASCAGFVQEMLIKVWMVTRKYSGSIPKLLPFLILTGSYLAVGVVDPDVWLTSPRTSLHIAIFLFVEMSTSLMLAHVTAQPYRASRRWQLLPLMGLTAWIGLLGGRSNPTIQYWLTAYAWSLGTYLLFKTVLVIHEICNTLGIWCFDIVHPHPARATSSKDD